ncbi:hypothetical protein OAO62_04795, partial [Gammaproteobacteria bacterium]|nr:hypothetical protein [Gammaproteobacteria bacterium]
SFGLDINRTKGRRALKILLCNVAKYKKAEMLYSRRHESALPKKLNPWSISNKTIYGVIDKLEEKGLVENKLGDSYKDAQKLDHLPHMSKFKATKELIDLVGALGLLENGLEEKEQSYIWHRTSKKKGKRKHAPYVEDAYSQRTEKIMSEISGYLNEQIITCEGESLTPMHLTRRYNAYDNSGDLRFGGRAYDPYMSFPKEKRDKILINGKPTKSLDYSASVFSIMYEVLTGIKRKDVAVQVQPYEFQAFERDVVKTYLTIMLNTFHTGFRDAVKNYYEKEATPEEVEHHNHALNNHGGIKGVQRIIKEGHVHIAGFLGQGKQFGGHFSWLEANITHEVQHYGCINWDIPILTVYDEFIFPEDKEDAVEELMFTVGLHPEYEHPYTEIIKEHAEYIRQEELDKLKD